MICSQASGRPKTTNCYAARVPRRSHSGWSIRRLAVANVFDANATVNVANTISDLATAMDNLANNDVPLRTPVWIMSPRSVNYLRTLLNSQGQFVLRAEVDAGRLFGWPIYPTNNIPNNLGAGSDESLIIALDASEVLLGTVDQVMIDRSNAAAVTLDGVLTSLFETDRAAIRTRLWNDVRLRHDVSISVMEQVTWGAA
ncbi:MAG TPA: phage major capsid protein [Gammaproteobacteria bacterium]|nr:phage major capsid protein [Gammaproteobacteria bacterium]